MFGAAAIYGATTKRSLAEPRRDPVHGPDRPLVAMVVNLFLASDALAGVISIVGVVLFTALTAFDVQRIQAGDLAARDRVPREGGGPRRADASTWTSSTCSCSCSASSAGRN